MIQGTHQRAVPSKQPESAMETACVKDTRTKRASTNEPHARKEQSHHKRLQVLAEKPLQMVRYSIRLPRCQRSDPSSSKKKGNYDKQAR